MKADIDSCFVLVKMLFHVQLQFIWEFPCNWISTVHDTTVRTIFLHNSQCIF